jgi:hypothetical protein
VGKLPADTWEVITLKSSTYEVLLGMCDAGEHAQQTEENNTGLQERHAVAHEDSSCGVRPVNQ